MKHFNKAYILSALFIGILATLWASITWLPLALGVQVCQYSEPRQYVAIGEFSCIVAGLVYLVFVFIHSIKAK